MRCMLYLLGELPAGERAIFEKQLSDSPDLSDELRAQSELICAISAPAPTSVSVRSKSNNRSWQLVAIVSTLAATFLVSIVGLRWQHNRDVAQLAPPDQRQITGQTEREQDGNREALMIAQAWAADHAEAESMDVDFNLLDADFPLGSDASLADESSNQESVVSWMVVAVADQSDTQSLPSGATTDG